MKKLIRWAAALGLCLALALCGALAAEASDISVQLDGQTLTFTDAVPQVKEQRTFLPFRAVFEAMGAEVDYQGSVITAVRGDKTLTMTLGQTTATVTEGGKTTTITMDVAPYVDSATWRTYVPVRFAAQAFDCVVGWDQAAYTAIIIDTDKLVDAAMAGKRFTYFEKAMALSEKYNDGIWDMTATFDADVSVMTMPMTMTGAMTGTVQDSDKMSVDMNMKVDMSRFVAMASALGGGSASAEDQAMLEALKKDGVGLTMRGDMAAGKLYMNMDMGTLAATQLDPDTWYALDMDALMKQSGADWTDLISEPQYTDMLAVAKAAVATAEPTDAAHGYADIKATLEAVVDAFSDDGFALVDGQRVASYAQEEDDSALTLVVVLELDGETVTGYSMGMDMTREVADQIMEMSTTVSVDGQDNTNAEVTMEMGEFFTLKLTLDGKYAPGSTAPVVTPPEGATVVDYMELMGNRADLGSVVIG